MLLCRALNRREAYNKVLRTEKLGCLFCSNDEREVPLSNIGGAERVRSEGSKEQIMAFANAGNMKEKKDLQMKEVVIDPQGLRVYSGCCVKHRKGLLEVYSTALDTHW